MDMGIPVIASNIGGIPELVINHETGLLFEPNNVEDLQRKINYLYNNHEKRKQIEKNSKLYANNLFDQNVYYNKLTELYNQSIKKI